MAALAAALSFGTGDFLGGVATRCSASVIPVVVVSQVVGLGVVLVLMPIFPGDFTSRALLVGSLGGIGGALGLALLYRGLAIGRMTVVAPIAALGAAVLPLVWGLVSGDRPGAAALIGVLIGLVAIPLVAMSGAHVGEQTAPGTRGIREAAGASIGFAVFFIALDGAGDATGVVPLLAARVTSIPLFVVGGLAMGRSLALHSGALLPAIGAGAFDMIANGLFLAATRLGLLSVVAVLASLYPATTIILARTVLHERLARVQMAGLAIAGVGVVLMATG